MDFCAAALLVTVRRHRQQSSSKATTRSVSTPRTERVSLFLLLLLLAIPRTSLAIKGETSSSFVPEDHPAGRFIRQNTQPSSDKRRSLRYVANDQGRRVIVQPLPTAGEEAAAKQHSYRARRGLQPADSMPPPNHEKEPKPEEWGKLKMEEEKAEKEPKLEDVKEPPKAEEEGKHAKKEEVPWEEEDKKDKKKEEEDFVDPGAGEGGGKDDEPGKEEERPWWEEEQPPEEGKKDKDPDAQEPAEDPVTDISPPPSPRPVAAPPQERPQRSYYTMDLQLSLWWHSKTGNPAASTDYIYDSPSGGYYRHMDEMVEQHAVLQSLLHVACQDENLLMAIHNNEARTHDETSQESSYISPLLEFSDELVETCLIQDFETQGMSSSSRSIEADVSVLQAEPHGVQVQDQNENELYWSTWTVSYSVLLIGAYFQQRAQDTYLSQPGDPATVGLQQTTEYTTDKLALQLMQQSLQGLLDSSMSDGLFDELLSHQLKLSASTEEQYDRLTSSGNTQLYSSPVGQEHQRMVHLTDSSGAEEDTTAVSNGDDAEGQAGTASTTTSTTLGSGSSSSATSAATGATTSERTVMGSIRLFGIVLLLLTLSAIAALYVLSKRRRRRLQSHWRHRSRMRIALQQQSGSATSSDYGAPSTLRSGSERGLLFNFNYHDEHRQSRPYFDQPSLLGCEMVDEGIIVESCAGKNQANPNLLIHAPDGEVDVVLY